MKYLIAGTGGVGGSIAGFLSMAGKDVTCIARGAHLQSIQTNGLKLKSDLKGEHTLRIPATTAEEFSGKADVIFVCVKGYSVDSIVELIKRAAHKDTVVIPILNVYGTGPRIQKLVPEVTVLDGCIYIVGFVSGTGEITQMGKIFRLVYGAHHGTVVKPGLLEAIQQDLQEAGIKVDLSPDINRDTFIKWSFISAMAVTVTDSQRSSPSGMIQLTRVPGPSRDVIRSSGGAVSISISAVSPTSALKDWLKPQMLPLSVTSSSASGQFSSSACAVSMVVFCICQFGSGLLSAKCAVCC